MIVIHQSFDIIPCDNDRLSHISMNSQQPLLVVNQRSADITVWSNIRQGASFQLSQ